MLACNAGFTPRSRVQLLVPYRWTGGSPASIHGLVVSVPYGWSSARKGRRANHIRDGAGLRKTVTSRVISVIFCHARRFGRRRVAKAQDASAFAQVVVSYTAPCPRCDLFVM